MPNKKEIQKINKNELVDMYISLHEQKEELARLSRANKKKAEYLEKKLFASLEVVTELHGGIQAHQGSVCVEPFTKKEIESMEKHSLGFNRSHPMVKDKTDPHSLMIGWISGFITLLRYDHLQYIEGAENETRSAGYGLTRGSF